MEVDELPLVKTVQQGGHQFTYATFGKGEGHRRLPAATWFSVMQVHGAHVWQVQNAEVKAANKQTLKQTLWQSVNSEITPEGGYDGLFICKKAQPLKQKVSTDSKNLVASETKLEGAAINTAANLLVAKNGHIVKNSKIGLIIKTADCLPVFIHYSGPLGFCAMALHCGWHSLAAGIICNAVKELQSQLKLSTKNTKDFFNGCKVYLAPAIGSCCYEVADDLKKGFLHLFNKYKMKEGDYFKPATSKVNNADKKYFLSIASVAKTVFLVEGFLEENIFVNRTCTKCTPELYSHRRNKEKKRNYNVLMVQTYSF